MPGCGRADSAVCQPFGSQGGATFGLTSATQLALRSVDVGNPALATHSIREPGGVLDHHYMYEAFKAFYEAWVRGSKAIRIGRIAV